MSHHDTHDQTHRQEQIQEARHPKDEMAVETDSRTQQEDFVQVSEK